MKYNYDGKEYVVEYVVMGEEEYDIWLQNEHDMDDYHYVDGLEDVVKDELYALVANDADSSGRDERLEMVGYLD